MAPKSVFVFVVLLLIIVVVAHVFAAERAEREPCERVGGAAPHGIMAYVVRV